MEKSKSITNKGWTLQSQSKKVRLFRRFIGAM